MHMERRWRHVSASCSGQRLQRGEGNWVGQIVCSPWFLMYCLYRGLRVCMICAFMHWGDD